MIAAFIVERTSAYISGGINGQIKALQAIQGV